MPQAKRSLALADVASVQALIGASHRSDEPYQALGQLAQSVLGHRLFTVMRHMPESAEVERVYSSNVDAYPLGGRKRKLGTRWGEKVLDAGEVFIAANRDELREAFPDHELIFSLGIGSIMNVPVKHDGQTLGTVNICGEAGQYTANDVPTAKIIGALILPVFLAAKDR